ncbi:MAG: tetratricopeptide repeat-containing sensor histidine kinase [Bacteroidales bacterium]|nr:tetratricopeptide repeat-containing sensor histidine kinase [Bacteroidales bacterium]
MRSSSRRKVNRSVVLRMHEISLLLFFIVLVPRLSAQSKQDSLIRELNAIKNDTSTIKKIELLIMIGDEMKFSYPDSSEQYLREAYDLAEQNNYRNKMAQSISGIGGVKYVMGEYDFALENFIKALHMWEDTDNKRGIAVGLNNIGLIQNMQEHYQQSINNHIQSAEICKQVKDTQLLATNYFNLGISYEALQHYDSALYYAKRALTLERQLGRHNASLRIQNLLGRIYLEKKQYQKALDAYRQVINAPDYENKWELSYAMAGLAEVYHEMGILEKSIEYGLKSYDLAREVGAKWDLQNVTGILAKSFAGMDNWKRAYEYHRLHKVYSDSVFNEKRENQINYLRLKRQQSENEALLNENRLQDLIITKRNYQLTAVIAGVVVLLVLAFLLYRNNNLKNKRNKKLKAKNTEIARKNEELQELNTTKDTLFRIIAHDLKNPVSVINSYTELIIDEFDDFDREELLDITHKLHKSSNETLRLLDNLMQWARSETGTVSFSPENIDIQQVYNDNFDLLMSSSREKKINLTSAIPEGLVAYADFNLTSTILRNLIANAIKFTDENGRVSIQAYEKNEMIEVSVLDTGTGMSQETIDNLFNTEKGISQKGTHDEKGTGLGLVICKDFVEKQNGTLSVESELGKGSRFSFTLPKAAKEVE